MSPKKVDKRRLAAKLEEITENVASRGVYISVASGDWYSVIDYVTKSEIVKEVPGRDIADRIANRMNSYKVMPSNKVKRARELVDGLHKYGNDIEFYRNIIKKTDDDVRRDTAWMRLNHAKQYLEKLIRDLNRI